jgi:hypothetical protein
MRRMKALGAGLVVVVLCAGCGSDSTDLECGPGTIEIEDLCTPEGEGSGSTCGPGTHEEDGVCVADGEELACGPGTTARDGECVPTATWFEMRTTVAEIAADGISKIPILLIGEGADGQPATDLVVLAVDRPNAGQFLQSSIELSPTGTIAYYRPCNAFDNPMCAGPVELQMFVAGDLERPVATLELELVGGASVYSPASCLVGGNAMFFDGNGYIWEGTLSVTEGAWTLQSATDKFVSIRLEPAGQENGSWWWFEFSALRMDVPLMPGIYEMAERYPFESAQRPGMDVTGDGRGCNTIQGRFQVHEYARSGASIESLTVSFEQHCDGLGNVLYGCVHLEQ